MLRLGLGNSFKLSEELDRVEMRCVGILADAHGNGPAFNRSVSVLKELGAESFRFLGDAIGYIPSFSVLDSLRQLGSDVHCIRGNHEQMLLSDHIVESRDAVYQLTLLKAAINSEYLGLMAEWGLTLNEKLAGQSALFVHGSPEDPTAGYVYPNSDLSTFQPDADIVFMGHSHRPFIRECNGVQYVNVGSCGLPRDDGRFGSAALFNPETCEIRVVRFDITKETEAALAAFPSVHHSVRSVLARRSEKIYGDIL